MDNIKCAETKCSYCIKRKHEDKEYFCSFTNKYVDQRNDCFLVYEINKLKKYIKHYEKEILNWD